MHAPQATAMVGDGAGRHIQRVGEPFEELFDGVDDLIKRVADTENPEIRKIRAKVHASMVVAKSAFRGGAARARRPQARSGGVGEEYLDVDPDQALGVALLVGVGLSVFMSIQP